MIFQPTPRMNQDPRWHEISASLRNGTLWVKMPRDRTRILIEALQRAQTDLVRKEIRENVKSFMFYGPVADWNEDLQTLESAADKDSSGTLGEFARVIAAGLRNDPEVDWVTRIGGPPREDAQALEALQTAPGEPAVGDTFEFPIV